MSAAIVTFPRRSPAPRQPRRPRRPERWWNFNDDGTPRTPTEAEAKLTELLVEITAFGSQLRQLGETNPDTFRQTLHVFKGVVNDLLVSNEVRS